VCVCVCVFDDSYTHGISQVTKAFFFCNGKIPKSRIHA
jgi:hypothetical protein